MVFVHTHSCSIHRVTCDTATLLNLYLLLNAVRALNRFAPLHVDDFAITSLANSTACLRNSRSPPPPPPPPFGANGTAAPKTFMDALLGAKDLGAVQKLAVDTLQTGLHSISADIKTSVAEAAPQRADDLASIYRECRSTLTQAAGVATGLERAKSIYWRAAYTFVLLALVLDCLRWCGCCSCIVDGLLGFRSQRLERLRLAYLWAMLGPFAHLSWLLCRPIELPCCVGSPKPESVFDRVGVLAWLCILVSYSLFSDAHNHGFFMLRCKEAGPCRLLRANLSRLPAAEEVKGASAV